MNILRAELAVSWHLFKPKYLHVQIWYIRSNLATGTVEHLVLNEKVFSEHSGQIMVQRFE